MRSNDIFASHTVTNPQGWRMADPKNADKRTPPTLRVVAEDDAGVTINGLKMLGYRDRVLPRDLVRQPPAGGAGRGEGIDHLRGAAECAGREHLVAEAL